LAAPAPHPAALDEAALLARCEERRTKGSGPGGQHRNKVETKVVLTHRATGIVGQAGERRSQAENRHVALRRLRLALAVAVRSPAAAAAAPSALWRSRCRGGRVACNPSHADFPALIAEALDVLADAGHDPRRAGAILACTPTQLVRLLADHPPALAALNAARAARGMHALR
jgi:peptide chain release factor-like protein